MLSIIYQDASIWIFNKPSNIHSVINKNSKESSIAEQIISEYPHTKNVASKEGDAGLLNRLDYETSGILLAAKNREAWDPLRTLLLKGEIEKRYLILVEGQIKTATEVQCYLGARHRGSKKVTAYTQAKLAKNRLLPSRSLFIPRVYDKKLDLTLVEVVAATARRHQIRAHASYIKHPLVGDKLYGSRRDIKPLLSEKGGIPSFFLHSWKVRFKHPISNKLIAVTAPLPEDFLGLKLFKDLRD